MQCFLHPNDSAVGICKSCGKGICRACAIQVDRGLACSDACKPFVESLSKLQQTTIRNIGLISAQRLIQPLFAAVFLATGFYLLVISGSEPFVWFLLAGGGVFALSTVLTWVKVARSKS
jgi:hypothetical protein